MFLIFHWKNDNDDLVCPGITRVEHIFKTKANLSDESFNVSKC